MGSSCQLYLSVYPVGDAEVDRLCRALRRVSPRPHWLERRAHEGAWLVACRVESDGQDGPEALGQRLATVIWSQLGRYARIALEAEMSNEEKLVRRELSETDFRAYRA
jgi:hypothetical protein